MRPLQRLQPGDPFPPTQLALDEPNGLLAVGGALDTGTLLQAYRQGIFPWYQTPQPVLWWTPDPRSVLFPENLHISRSLRRTLRRKSWRLSVDRHFTDVMMACAEPRADDPGTWIDQDMIRAYTRLHTLGLAHSVEVLDNTGVLIGGLYGVAVGGIFFGESMFSRCTDGSKAALVALVRILSRAGFRLIDCQVENPHLMSLGASRISRLDFEHHLAQTIDMNVEPNNWRLPMHCGELL